MLYGVPIPPYILYPNSPLVLRSERDTTAQQRLAVPTARPEEQAEHNAHSKDNVGQPTMLNVYAGQRPMARAPYPTSTAVTTTTHNTVSVSGKSDVGGANSYNSGSGGGGMELDLSQLDRLDAQLGALDDEGERVVYSVVSVSMVCCLCKIGQSVGIGQG